MFPLSQTDTHRAGLVLLSWTWYSAVDVSGTSLLTYPGENEWRIGPSVSGIFQGPLTEGLLGGAAMCTKVHQHVVHYPACANLAGALC